MCVGLYRHLGLSVGAGCSILFLVGSTRRVEVGKKAFAGVSLYHLKRGFFTQSNPFGIITF